MGALAGSHQRQVLCVMTAHPAGGCDGLRVAVHAAGFGGCVVKIMCVMYMSKVSCGLLLCDTKRLIVRNRRTFVQSINNIFTIKKTVLRLRC